MPYPNSTHDSLREDSGQQCVACYTVDHYYHNDKWYYEDDEDERSDYSDASGVYEPKEQFLWDGGEESEGEREELEEYAYNAWVTERRMMEAGEDFYFTEEQKRELIEKIERHTSNTSDGG